MFKIRAAAKEREWSTMILLEEIAIMGVRVSDRTIHGHLLYV